MNVSVLNVRWRKTEKDLGSRLNPPTHTALSSWSPSQCYGFGLWFPERSKLPRDAGRGRRSSA